MNSKDTGPLLSAYLDGEASPEEREAAEQLLESSAEARRELEDLAALSELLQTVPPDPAPVELAPAVLRRAERETLLSAGPTENASPAVAKLSRRRRWMAVVSGLIATTVAMLLVVSAFTPPDGRRDGNLHVAEQAVPDDKAPLARREHAVPEDAVPKRDRGSVPAESPASDSAAEESAEPEAPVAARSEIQERRHEPAEGVATPEGRESAPAEPLGRESDPAEPLLAFDDSPAEKAGLSTVRIGDVIPYFEQGGDRVAVIEVTVVDIQQAVGMMQVLLTKNSIPPMDEESGDEQQAADAPASEDDRADDLFAVYVETTESRLASTLDELQHKELFVGLKLQRPVVLEQVEAASGARSVRGRLSRLYKEGNEKPETKASAEPSDNSFQLLMNLPATAWTPEGKQARQRSAAGDRAGGATPPVLRNEPASPVRDDAEARPAAPLRVIFVFQGHPPTSRDS